MTASRVPALCCKTNLDEMRIREAEGYLSLVTACSGSWEPPAELRDPLVRRAMAALDRLSDAERRKPYVLYLEGEALRTMERYPEAIRVLRQATESEPDNVGLWLALGWCFKRLRRLDRAIESLEKALSIQPDSALIHYNLACYWSLAGNVDVAVAYLTNAFDIDDSYRKLVAGESDFDPIRHTGLFRDAMRIVV